MGRVALLSDYSASRTSDRPADGLKSRATLALALLSFVIYACTVFTLPQLRNSLSCCEQPGVAAAISNILYGAPLGSLYSGTLRYFFDRRSEPLSQTLERVQTPVVGLSAISMGVLSTARDGNGVGYPLVATAAFRMFGIHAWSLQLTTLLFMALTAAAFLWRFHSAAFAGVVTLYFTALTVMLFTSIVWDPQWATEIGVGGVRYFSLIGVLPLFHILLTLLDTQPSYRKNATRNAVLLALQTALFLLIILVRGSALPEVVAIALVCMALAWRYWSNTERLQCLFRKLAVMGLAGFVGLSAIVIAVSNDYLTEGRFEPNIWERVIVSLGVNPAWPFAGLNEMFDCKEFIPKGLQGGPLDRNADCIWFDYASKHQIPADKAYEKIRGGSYETVMREAFFKIAARDPEEVLKTFIYYKPMMIYGSIRKSMRFNFDGDQSRTMGPAGALVVQYPPVSIALLFVALAVALVHFTLGAVSTIELWRIAGVTLLLALFTLPNYIAAWAAPHTSADFLLFCLLGLGLAVGAPLVGAQSVLAQRTNSRGPSAVR